MAATILARAYLQKYIQAHTRYNSGSTISGFSITLISIALIIVFTVFVAVYDKMWRKEVHAPRTED